MELEIRCLVAIIFSGDKVSSPDLSRDVALPWAVGLATDDR